MPLPHSARRRPTASNDGVLEKRVTYPISMPFVIFSKSVRGRPATFSVNPQAIEFLQTLAGRPLRVVALAGPYRTGKSLLLNRGILNLPPSEGFEVSPQTNACTKGIHLCTKLLGEANDILVLDTEGLGATSADQTHDARIFTLALLLCSLLLLNTKGAIDQPGLEMLALVANIGQHLRQRGAGGSADDADGAMPPFVWVVRDFALRVVNAAGTAISEAEYLEQALTSDPDATVEKNKTRAELRNFFRERTCITLPRPCADDVQLQDLNTAPDEALTEEFRHRVAALRVHVLSHVKLKRACGRDVDGPLLARMAEVYCTAMNDGKAPAVQDAWTLVSQRACAEAVGLGEAAFGAALATHGLYVDGRGDDVAVPAPKIEQALQEAFNAGGAAFRAEAMGNTMEEASTRLRQVLTQLAQRLRDRNLAIVRREAHAECARIEVDVLSMDSWEAARRFAQQAGADFLQRLGHTDYVRAAWDAEMALHAWDWSQRFHANVMLQHATNATRLVALEAQLAEVRACGETASRQAEATADELRLLRTRLDEAETRAQRLAQEAATQSEEVERLTTEHQTQLDEARAMVTAYAARAEVAESMVAEASNRQAELEAKAVDAQTQRARADAEAARATKAELEVQQADGQRQRIEAEVHRAQQRIEALEAELDTVAGDQRREMEALQQQTETTIASLWQGRATAETRARAVEEKTRATIVELEGTHRAMIQQCEVERNRLVKTLEEERVAAREEATRLRQESSSSASRFQQQLEEMGTEHRKEQREQSTRAREEQRKLSDRLLEVSNRAQTAEVRAVRAEDQLAVLRKQQQERDTELRKADYEGRLREAERTLETERTRCRLLEEGAEEQGALQDQHEAELAELRSKLRTIETNHAATLLKQRLDFEQRLSGNNK
jgi:hypothetical protein